MMLLELLIDWSVERRGWQVWREKISTIGAVSGRVPFAVSGARMRATNAKNGRAILRQTKYHQVPVVEIPKHCLHNCSPHPAIDYTPIEFICKFVHLHLFFALKCGKLSRAVSFLDTPVTPFPFGGDKPLHHSGKIEHYRYSMRS